MPQTQSRDDLPMLPFDDVSAEPAPPGAGAAYRQHLDRFPERGTETALERAAKALIRAAQIRLKGPSRAD